VGSSLTLLGTAIPELSLLLVLADTPASLVEVRDIVCRVFVPSFCRAQIPSECLSWIGCDTFSATEANSNRELSFENTFLRSPKL
jgi:hypothetical protein